MTTIAKMPARTSLIWVMFIGLCGIELPRSAQRAGWFREPAGRSIVPDFVSPVNATRRNEGMTVMRWVKLCLATARKAAQWLEAHAPAELKGLYATLGRNAQGSESARVTSS